MEVRGNKSNRRGRMQTVVAGREHICTRKTSEWHEVMRKFVNFHKRRYEEVDKCH